MGIAKEPPVEIDFKIILVIGAIGVVLAMSAPGAAAARCEPCDGIVAVKAGGEQDAVGGLLHAGLDQQIDVADIAQSGIGIDVLRQRNAFEHPGGNSCLLQQIAEAACLREIAESAQRILCGGCLQSGKCRGRRRRSARGERAIDQRRDTMMTAERQEVLPVHIVRRGERADGAVVFLSRWPPNAPQQQAELRGQSIESEDRLSVVGHERGSVSIICEATAGTTTGPEDSFLYVARDSHHCRECCVLERVAGRH